MNLAQNVKFLQSGDMALVVEFGDEIDLEISAAVLALAAKLDTMAIHGVIETVPTFRSLMIYFDPSKVGQSELRNRVYELLGGLDKLDSNSRLWTLPACYDPAVAPDLQEVASQTGLSPADVVEKHSSVTYHVYMIGFLPGYPYMGDIVPELRLPRRQNPRVSVPTGSIAIAMGLTAVYTMESPGGWHLIGRTPIPLWNLSWSPPALFAPGDKVKFEPVSLDRMRELENRIEREGSFIEPQPMTAERH